MIQQRSSLNPDTRGLSNPYTDLIVTQIKKPNTATTIDETADFPINRKTSLQVICVDSGSPEVDEKLAKKTKALKEKV